MRGATREAHLNHATGRPRAGHRKCERAVRPNEIEGGRDTDSAGDLEDLLRNLWIACVDCVRGAGFTSDFELAVIEVNGDDFRAGQKPQNLYAELAERAASDDEHGVVWAYVWECPLDCAVRRQRRISERRRRLGLERIQLYEIPLVRHEQVLGVAALMLRQSDPLHRWAQVLLARDAVVAESVAPAAVDRNAISFLYGVDAVANRRDRAGVLVAKSERHPRKYLDVARDDVEVAVTEAGAFNPDDDLAGTRRRSRDVVDHKWLPVLVQSRGLHVRSPR